MAFGILCSVARAMAEETPPTKKTKVEQQEPTPIETLNLGTIRLKVPADDEAEPEEFDKTDLLQEMFGWRVGTHNAKRSVAKLTAEFQMLPYSFMVVLIEIFETHLATPEFLGLPPLKVNAADHGWCHPCDLSALKHAQNNTDGKYLCAVGIETVILLMTRQHLETPTWTAIAQVMDVLFPGGHPKDVVQILHCMLVKKELVHTTNHTELIKMKTLEPKSLEPCSRFIILWAIVASAVKDLASSGVAKVEEVRKRWWPVMRSIVVCIHSETAKKNRLLVMATSNEELHGLGQALRFSSLTKFEIALNMRDELDEALNNSAPKRNVTYKELANAFSTVPSVDKNESFSNERSIRTHLPHTHIF